MQTRPETGGSTETTTIVTFEVDGRHCPVTRELPRSGAAELELDTAALLGGDAGLHLLVRGPERDRRAVEAAAGADPAVDAVTTLDRAGDQWRLSLDLAEDADGVFGRLRAADAAVESASGTPRQWEFAVRFYDRETLSQFHADCVADDVRLSVGRVARADGGATGESTPLTETQRETLVTAHETGYYDVPRATTALDLADELGISDQSLSERLRRAHRRLVERYVA